MRPSARFLKWARYGLLGAAVVLFYLSLQKVDLLALFRGANYGELLLACVVHVFTVFMTVVQFKDLMLPLEPLTYRKAARGILTSQALSVVLPGVVGEASVAPVAAADGARFSHSFAAFAVSKIINVGIVIVTVGFYLAFGGVFQASAPLAFLRWPHLLGAAGLVLLLGIVAWRCRWMERIGNHSAVASALSSIRKLVSEHPALLLRNIVWGALKFMGCACFMWLVLKALRVEIPLIAAMGASALASLSSLVPLTPRNFGVYEGTFAFFASSALRTIEQLFLASTAANVIGVGINILLYAILVILLPHGERNATIASPSP